MRTSQLSSQNRNANGALSLQAGRYRNSNGSRNVVWTAQARFSLWSCSLRQQTVRRVWKFGSRFPCVLFFRLRKAPSEPRSGREEVLPSTVKPDCTLCFGREVFYERQGGKSNHGSQTYWTTFPTEHIEKCHGQLPATNEKRRNQPSLKTPSSCNLLNSETSTAAKPWLLQP